MIAEKRRKENQILLVENCPISQQITMRYLRGAEYEVDHAENGKQAVEAARRKNYNLILMDIEMPVLDGYGATKAIRKLEKSLAPGYSSKGEVSTNDKWQMTNDGSVATRVPIVAMTAHATKSHRERCLEVGMDDYITKPLSKIELLAIVDKWSDSNSEFGIRNGEWEHKTGNAQPTTTVDQQSSIVTSQSKSAAPMDFDRAVAEFEGDREFLVKVLKDFLRNSHSQIATIRKGISDGDPEVVRKEAHSIKGGAADLRANDLMKTAYELEQIGKARNLDTGMEALEKLENELNRLENFYEGWE